MRMAICIRAMRHEPWAICLFFLHRSIGLFHSRLEVSNALAQTFAQFTNLARAEDQQCDSKDDEKFRKSKITHNTPLYPY